jgi:NADH-quinone oxidoreductase subunit M
MNVLHLPWLEAAILTALAGALCVSQVRDPYRAARGGLTFTGLALVATLLAWLAFFVERQDLPAAVEPYSLQPYLFGRQVFALDALGAPLVPAVALLHYLIGLATPRTKMRRFSYAWSLTTLAVRLATFSTSEPWVVIGLLAAGTVSPYIELLNRRRPTRVYVLYMAISLGLMVLGYGVMDAQAAFAPPPAWAVAALLAGILVRCGTAPAHCWLTDWFEHASFGIGILFVIPLTGVYAAVRLVLPVAPDWVLQGIGLVSLVTAVYAAGMASVQREARRFYAYLFLSHSSLVLVGLQMVTATALTGALCLWFAVVLSLGGFGLTLRALEARFGRLALTDFHGLYEQSPTLAVCFLLTGLASVGFPGTLGFISTELLVDGAVEANVYVGLAVVAAAALNGIAVVRAYFLLFTGTRHASMVSLGIGPRERFAVLTLSALILGGGLFPQPGVHSRHKAAEEILKDRRERPRLVQDPPPVARGDEAG